MTNFATLMASGDKLLRRLPPMRRDIFRHTGVYDTFFFLTSILLISNVFGISIDNNWV
jgi:hypothetical protein